MMPDKPLDGLSGILFVAVFALFFSSTVAGFYAEVQRFEA